MDEFARAVPRHRGCGLSPQVIVLCCSDEWTVLRALCGGTAGAGRVCGLLCCVAVGIEPFRAGCAGRARPSGGLITPRVGQAIVGPGRARAGGKALKIDSDADEPGFLPNAPKGAHFFCALGIDVRALRNGAGRDDMCVLGKCWKRLEGILQGYCGFHIFGQPPSPYNVRLRRLP